MSQFDACTEGSREALSRRMRSPGSEFLSPFHPLDTHPRIRDHLRCGRCSIAVIYPALSCALLYHT